MRNLNPSVKGFQRGRYVRELQDGKGNFRTIQPEKTSKLSANNKLRRIAAIKLYDKRVALGLKVSAQDPRYPHLHATKGWKNYPA